MELWKGFRRLTLLCLLTASLHWLIDDVGGAVVGTGTGAVTPAAPAASPQPHISLQMEGKGERESAELLGSDRVEVPAEESDRQARLSFTVPPMFMKQKRRRVQTQKQRQQQQQQHGNGGKANLTTATSTKEAPAAGDIILEKMDDLEYSAENGTSTAVVVVGGKGNKTVSSGDKVDPAIEVEDNFCPLAAAGRAVYQSTLPGLILLLNIGVHIVGFVLLLYWWKTIYYSVGDPYVTISPYGYGPGGPTPPPPLLGKSDSGEARDLLAKAVEGSLGKYK